MFELIPFGRRSLSNYFDDFEKSFYKSWNANAISSIKTDIIEKEDAYLIEAELPGFEKKDISIDINDNLLTVKAENSSENEEKDDKGNYIRRERKYGSFSRSFDISNINAEEISAEHKDGILKITLPKIEELKPQAKKIEIS